MIIIMIIHYTSVQHCSGAFICRLHVESWINRKANSLKPIAGRPFYNKIGSLTND